MSIGSRYRSSYDPVFDAMRQRREAAERRNQGRGQAESLDRWTKLGAAAAPIAGGALGAGIGAATGGPMGAMAGLGVGSAAGQGVGSLLGILGNESTRKYQEGDEEDAAYRAALLQALASM